MINGSPQVVLDAVDLHEDLIQMPLPLCVLAHVRRSFGSDLSSEDGSETINPEPNALMADIDPTLVKKIFNVAQ